MNTVETILEHFRSGRVTRREALVALASLLTPENVGDVMATVPPDVAADLERWAAGVPAQGSVVIGANLSSEEGRRLAERLEVAGCAVREWAAGRPTHAASDRDGTDPRSSRPIENGS